MFNDPEIEQVPSPTTSPNQETTVVLVRDMAQMQAAYDVRRQVFLVEGGENEEEEFDGNDFCAAHLLAFWNGKPVGTMRLRIVSGSEGGTIIWERLAITKDAREANPWLFRKILNAARHYTELMGLKHVIGIVENPKLMRFWRIYGGKDTGEAPLDMGGHTYRPIRLTIKRDSPMPTPTLREAILPVPQMFEETRRTV
ncbi:MAG: hypothetical protein AAF631_01290 [Pseudomonadota bacterium]